MKFYTSIPPRLKQFYNVELQKYRKEYSNGNLEVAWHHLERAHIIGQRYPYTHSYVHWKMLRFGIKIQCPREVLGQIPRIIFGGVKSFVGKVPIGNPGGSNVPPFKSFPIDKDLQKIFEKEGVDESFPRSN